MADLVVSPLFELLFNNLSSLIQSEVALVSGVKKQMEMLSRTLSTIRDVLQDAEEKQLTDTVIRNWLKDAAYDADDVLDECVFDGLQSGCENNSFTKQVTGSFKQIKLRHRIGKKIKELRERFDEIAERRHKFHLREGTVERRPGISQDRETCSVIDEPEVFGRDQDTEDLVKLVLNNVNSQQDISMCPILGIGGLGKTTLAQMVYNDERVAAHFGDRAWVCVSEDFDVKRLIKAVIESLPGKACNFKELDPLKRHLEENLHGKRFLLVLDDVWNENQDDWNKLKGSLRCGAKGSSVIVTTRLQTVASITGTLPVYCLEVLSEDNCWSLFRKRGFGYMNEERPDLVEIGKSLVKKCGGVPLAAKALGSMLRFNSDKKYWLSVRDSEILDLQQSQENNILQALRLSYNHLPSHLRQCFAYCSIFPKDCEIKKARLVRLWIANGLVQSKGGMEMEDVGNEIFNALLMRSFFQNVERDKDGNIEVCKMHDLVHDLACHIAMGECCIMNIEKVEKITRITRHLSMDSSTRGSSSQKVESILKSSPCLRSLIKFDAQLPINNLQFFFPNLKCLRALGLCRTSVTELPDSVGKMKHLRYLDLSNSYIESLPESIGKLRNLQTLDLTDCIRLKTWPRDMRKISSLRHLEIRGCCSLTNMPVEMGKLTCLQTLCFFIVGSESGRSIKELQGLNQLGGNLEIKELENVRNSSDAKEANLTRKENLRSLRLSWSGSLQENVLGVIEGLQPHSKLRRLTIKRYNGVQSPNWLKGSSSLPSLIQISLSYWEICDQLSLGKLPNLKILKMKEMESLKFIDDGVKGFPYLEELKLVRMPNLKRWSSCQSRSQGGGEGDLFPCLSELILGDCPRLINASIGGMPHLKVLDMFNMESLKFIDDGVYGEGAVKGFPCLEKLVLHGMPNLERWSSCQSHSQGGGEGELFPCLKALYLEGCPKLITVSTGGMPHLKVLEMYYMESIKFVDDGVYGEGAAKGFPCLEKLVMRGMPNLERWSSSQSQAELFPRLKELILEETPKLLIDSLPSSLQEVRVEKCNESVLGLLQNLPCLSKLEIWEFDKLEYFPEGMLRNLIALKVLHIKSCWNLESLPEGLRNLSSLKYLSIAFCYGLKRLTELSGMSNLECLRIDDCSELEISADDLCHLVALQTLELKRLPKLTCLPEGIKHSAAMLRVLKLNDCPNLMELPEWMQHLTHLQRLEIIECDLELDRRCEEDTGEDWYKISHIPKLVID